MDDSSLNYIITAAPIFVLFCAIIYFIVRQYLAFKKRSDRSTSDAPFKNKTLAVDDALPENLVLRKSNTLVHRENKTRDTVFATIYIICILLVLLIGQVIIPSLESEPSSLTDVITQTPAILTNELNNQPTIFIPLAISVLLIPFVFIIPHYMREEELELGPQGIHYRSAFQGSLNWLRPDWFIRWSDIELAKLGNILAPGQLTLKTHPPVKARRLLPVMWGNSENTSHTADNNIFARDGQRKNIFHDTEHFNKTPLIRYLKQHTHIRIESISPNPMTTYDLSSNPKTRKLSLLIVALCIYSLVDMMTISMREIHLPLLSWWLVLPGIVVTAALLPYLHKEAIHRFNKVGIPVFVGLLAAIASYPASLHINHLTDNGGLQEHVYIKSDTSTFKPASGPLPLIDISRFEFGKNRYWDSIDVGTSMKFKIRKGGLGFYQLDMRSIHKQSQHWHCTQQANKKNASANDC